ncbi:hypothetical protein FBR02_08590, partial [Anaerolineae bacterium CFX9]|nr:hypothetical protein [Anaerolineae bacterium CFX9]
MNRRHILLLLTLQLVLLAVFVFVASTLLPSLRATSDSDIPTLMQLPPEQAADAETVALAEAPAPPDIPPPAPPAIAAAPEVSAPVSVALQPTPAITRFTTEPTLTETFTATATATATASSTATRTPFPTLPPASPSGMLQAQPALPTLELPPPSVVLLGEPVSVPNQVVINFAPESSPSERAAYIQSIGGTVSSNLEALDAVVVNIPRGLDQNDLPPSAIVAEAEPDYLASIFQEEAAAASFPIPPNDTYYSLQWGLPAIGVPQAWAALPPSPITTIVAVIDTGICPSHPDLQGRIIAGYDFVDNDNNPNDPGNGHGCSVAGVIAANIHNAAGIAGAAPNTLIMPVRALDTNGFGSYSNIANAIVYATNNGAHIINLSLGGASPATVLQNAVNYAVSNGVTVVAAAGNTGMPGVQYPAAYAPVIAVASVDSNLQPSSFNSTGPEIDVYAPGRDIVTTDSFASPVPYSYATGTSFATPHVSAVAALLRAQGQTLQTNGGLVWAMNNGIRPTVTPTPSNTRTPTNTPTPLPIPVTPSGLTIVGSLNPPPVTPTYRWNHSTLTQGYYIYVGGPSGQVIGSFQTASAICGTSLCNFTPNVPLTAGSYVWKVIGWNTSGYGSYSPDATFVVGPTATNTPTFTPSPTNTPTNTLAVSLTPSPTNTPNPGPPAPTGLNVTGTLSPAPATPTYRWNHNPGVATGYYLYVGGSSGAAVQGYYSAASICSTSTCAVTPGTALAAGNYIFKVTAHNASGNYGPYSANFYIAVGGFPAVPTSLSVTGSLATAPATPTYRWNHDSSAQGYYMYVGNTSGAVHVGFYSAGTICSATLCQVTPGTALPAG